MVLTQSQGKAEATQGIHNFIDVRGSFSADCVFMCEEKCRQHIQTTVEKLNVQRYVCAEQREQREEHSRAVEKKQDK